MGPVRQSVRLYVVLGVAVAFGCAGVRAHDGTGGGQSGSGARGSGGAAGGSSSGGSGGGATGDCAHDLRAAVRDFRSGEKDGQPKHPDFEYVVGDDRGIVATMLGPDSKPVYAGGPNGTLTTTGKANFDQWYRDVDGINIHIDTSIPLVQDAGFAQSEGTRLVRVELPRSALSSFGIPVNGEQAGGRVKADVLLGEDGTARAIRFVQERASLSGR